MSLQFVTGESDRFNEELFIRTLQTGHVYAHFQFTTLWNISLGDDDAFSHFHLFPKALGEILHAYSVRELHLSLTQGRWRHESWAYPVIDAPAGSELWVWFMENRKNIDSTWTDLVNVLSGMFCASLNFMDAKTTITPKLSFRPQGITTNESDRWFSKNVHHAFLPREIVCTENLTPWKKLLPCGVKSGLSTLLNALKLYDASYHSLGLHFRPVCLNAECSQTRVELSQTISIVLDPVNSHGGKADWTMKRLFGRMVTTSCPLATVSSIYVDVASNTTELKLRPEPSSFVVTKRGSDAVRYAVYNIPEFVGSDRVLNLEIKYTDQHPLKNIPPPLLTATRFQTGYGKSTGGITCLIYNNHPTSDIIISYLEVIPWFIRAYFHTLKLEYFPSLPSDSSLKGITLKPLHMHFVPGKDRQRSYHLEFYVRLPAKSVTRLSFEFEKQLLKWTEYPPDANHGFYIGPAVISAVLPDAWNMTSIGRHNSIFADIFTSQNVSADGGDFFVRMYTESLLVSLPTPDFSMPYNVICLVCTVMAIAFGSVHNLTTRKFVLYDPLKHRGLITKIKDKVKEKLLKFKKKKIPIEDKEDAEAETEKEAVADDNATGAVGSSSESDVAKEETERSRVAKEDEDKQ